MRYVVNNIAKLPTILDGLPDEMGVEVDHRLGIDVKTVGVLRQLSSVPTPGMAVTTPMPRFPESVVKVDKLDE
jgi:hypothetical protein